MLARLRNAKENGESGFTLIELLVVMIIIGILAAIAIPAFLSQKAKARDTSAKADVSTIGKEVAAYYVDGTGRLGLFMNADNVTWELRESANATTAAVVADPLVTSGKLSAENIARGTATDASTFCFTVAAKNGSTKDFQYNATGLSKGRCGLAAATFP